MSLFFDLSQVDFRLRKELLRSVDLVLLFHVDFYISCVCFGGERETPVEHLLRLMEDRVQIFSETPTSFEHY